MQLKNKNISTYLFVLLMVVFAIHIGRHVNDFYVPESDFFDFRDKAITLRNLAWPENFKRPPLYSAAIAIVSSVIPGQHRELYAAEAICLISALLGLFFVYKIAEYLFSRGAIFIAWLWAFHPSTIRMAIKPKSEMLVTMLILWAFYLFLHKRKSAYLVGFFACMVRYEGALIIAAIGIADFFLRQEKIKTMIYSIAAGLPIVLWTLLQSGGGDGESYFSYFNEYKPNIAFLKTMWDGVVGFMPYQLSPLWLLVAVALFAIGCIYGWQKFRREIVGLLVFFGGFVLMHVVWPMPNFDYQVIIVWNALIFMGLGALGILNRIQLDFAKNMSSALRISAGLLILFLVVVFVLFKSVPFPQYKVDWRMMLLFLMPALTGLVAVVRPLKNRIGSLSVATAILVIVLYFMSSQTNALLYSIRYSKAEFRAVGEWFAAHARESDKMAVEQPVIVGYYADKSEQTFKRLTALKKTTPDSLHKWLQDNGITHISWMSANKIFDTDNAWFQWKMDNRGWHNIAFLSGGKSTNGFTLVKEIRIGPRWAFIYKI